MKICKSCGDRFDPNARKEEIDPFPVQPGELNHCQECANELYRGKVNPLAKCQGPGGGRRIVRKGHEMS